MRGKMQLTKFTKEKSPKPSLFLPLELKALESTFLSRIAVREPLKLKELRFRDLFVWLSNSLSAVSRSNLDENVPLSNPTTPEGWASV